MFTGIIQATVPVSNLISHSDAVCYAVELPSDQLRGLIKGASLSIDGVCQTVVEIKGRHIWFEAIEETLHRTTLSSLYIGKLVNVERSAKIGDEIGGHLLSGHIYGTAHIEKIDKNIYTFHCPASWMKFLFLKGFIAIDGISLTVAGVDRTKNFFSLNLIPETLKRTTLGSKQTGDKVNVEFDAMTQATVETVENFMQGYLSY